MKTTFRGGVHPKDGKEYARDVSFETHLPSGEVVLLLSQHIGKPAQPVVAKGDEVKMGQLVGKADGFVSANIYSSVSGTVKAVEPRKNAFGKKVPAVIVESDGQFTPAEGIGAARNPKSMSRQEILDAVGWAGIVGMGGAGFPTQVKLMPREPDKIKYIIANGAECEPYITCDDQLMRSFPDEIAGGMEILLSLFPQAKGVVLIEENKPEAINAMKRACAKIKGLSVWPVHTKYPQGGERSVITVVTGKHLRLGQLPADVGCIVDNVSTVRAIYRAVTKTEPLYERPFTVSGDAVANPKNLFIKLGTSFGELLQYAGGVKEGATLKKALSGGPMMGIAMADLDVPVQKNNGAMTVLAEDPAEKAFHQMTACLKCGRCNRTCPLGLTPQMMSLAAERRDYEQYEKLFGLDCVTCGSCTFACPAKRPLMQVFMQTKSEIMAIKKGGGK